MKTFNSYTVIILFIVIFIINSQINYNNNNLELYDILLKALDRIERAIVLNQQDSALRIICDTKKFLEKLKLMDTDK